MTLLAADIGNSDTVLGLLEGPEVVAHWRVSTDERRTADEWAVLIRGLLGRRVHAIDGIVVCSTVPSVTLAARDDGRGAALFRGGNGLVGMRERLETLGGQLELHPNPGRGFALTATLPT